MWHLITINNFPGDLRIYNTKALSPLKCILISEKHFCFELSPRNHANETNVKMVVNMVSKQIRSRLI